MKSWVLRYIMIAVILSGCAAPTQAPAPPQVLPSLTPVVESSPTITVITATQETALLQAATLETSTTLLVEQTATIQASETAQPTATSAMMIATVDSAPPASVSQPQPQPCQRPQGWVQYTVQRNDTLSSLGQRTGVGWQRIQAANCLAGTTIFAGQILYLPFMPAMPPASTPVQEIATPRAPPPGDPRTEVEPGSGPAGATFMIKVRDFDPLSMVTIRIEPVSGSPVSTFSVAMDTNGDRDVAWVSPSNLAAGPYSVRPFRPDGSQGKPGTILITQ